jgi:hypothetical protein
MTSVGYATLDVIPSFKNLARDLDRGISGPLRTAGLNSGTQFGDLAGKSAGSRFGSVFANAAKASLIGVAGAGTLAIKFGADAIEEASALNESLNAVRVTYGKQTRAINRLGRQSAESLGLSRDEFNGLAVQFSAFAKQVGGEKRVGKTLDELTTRGADFASVMNLEVNDALGLFQSGLAGETEPLRRFGIDLSAAAVEAQAYKSGIAEAGTELTEQQKVQARYASLMEQTSKVQGDFANTSDSLANRQRILGARWDDVQAKLGKGLLPVMEDFTGYLLDEGVPAVEKFGDWFTKDGIPALKEAAEFAGNASGKVADLVQAFRDLPDPAKFGGLAAVLAGGVTVKSQGGLANTLRLSRGSSAATPMYVAVTNPGFGTSSTGTTPDGKPRGRGNTLATALAAVSLPWIVEQLRAELMYPIDQIKKEQAKPLVFETQEQAVTFLDAAQKKAEGFGATLDLVGGKKVEPKFAVPGLAKGREGLAEFIRLQIDAGKPVTPYIHTTPIERAIGQMKTLNAEIARYTDPTRGIDNGVPTLRGGGASTGDRAGVTINIDKVEAQDVNHLLGDLQKRSQRRGHGGFGR